MRLICHQNGENSHSLIGEKRLLFDAPSRNPEKIADTVKARVEGPTGQEKMKKVKQALQDLKKMAKETGLGKEMEKRLNDYLKKALKDKTNRTLSYQDYTKAIDKLNGNERMKAWKKLELGLDNLLLRIDYRKRLAKEINKLPSRMQKQLGKDYESAVVDYLDGSTGFPPRIVTPEIAAQNIEEVINELMKYKTLGNRRSGPENAAPIPEGIAYFHPPEEGGNTVFVYWREGNDMYLMDNKVNDVQLLQRGKTGDETYATITDSYPRAKWEKAKAQLDKALKKKASGKSLMDDYLEINLKNQEKERLLSLRRNYPPNQEEDFSLVTDQRKENGKKIASGEMSEEGITVAVSRVMSSMVVSGSKGSWKNKGVENYIIKGNKALSRKLKQAVGQSATAGPGRAPGVPDAPDADPGIDPDAGDDFPDVPDDFEDIPDDFDDDFDTPEDPDEAFEAAESAELLEYPPGRVLAWGDFELDKGASAVDLGSVDRPEHLNTRAVEVALIDGLPVDVGRIGFVNIGDHDIMTLSSAAGEATPLPEGATITVYFKDTFNRPPAPPGGGPQPLARPDERHKVTYTVGPRRAFEDGSAGTIDGVEAVGEGSQHVDMLSLTKGPVTPTLGVGAPRAESAIGVLAPPMPGISRSVQTASVNGRNIAVQIGADGQTLFYRGGPPGPHQNTPLQPGQPITILYDITDNSNPAAPKTSNSARQIITLEHLPQVPAEDTEITTPERTMRFGALDTAALSADFRVLGRLNTISDPTFTRQIEDPARPDQPHPFLQIRNISGISYLTTRRDKPGGAALTDEEFPLGDFSFSVVAFRPGKAANPRISTYEFTNEELPEQEDLIPLVPIQGNNPTLERGVIESSNTRNGRKLLDFPALQSGVETREVVGLIGLDLSGFGVTLQETMDMFRFYNTKEGQALGFSDRGLANVHEIPEDSNIILQVASRDDSGKTIGTQMVSFKTAEGKELGARDLALEGRSGTVGGHPASRINIGQKQAAGGPLPLGIHVAEELRQDTTFTVESVRPDGPRGTTQLQHGADPIFEYDQNHGLQLRDGATIAPGRMYVELKSERYGKEQTHWIVVENGNVSPISAEDLRLTDEARQLNWNRGAIDARNGGVVFAQFKPARNGVERQLVSAKRGGMDIPVHDMAAGAAPATAVLIHDGVGKLWVNNGHQLPPGDVPIEMNFEARMTGRHQVEKQTKRLMVTKKGKERKPEVPLTPAQQERMRKGRKLFSQAHRVAALAATGRIDKDIADLPDGEKKEEKIQQALDKIPPTQRPTVIEIDGAAGRFAVVSYSANVPRYNRMTNIEVTNTGKYKITAGPYKYEESLTVSSAEEAIILAHTLNRLVAAGIGHQRHNFSSEAISTGEYFTYEGTSNTINFNEGGVTYDTDALTVDFPNATRKNHFLKLANIALSNVLGRSGKAPAIPPMPQRGAARLRVEGTMNNEVIKGRSINIKLDPLPGAPVANPYRFDDFVYTYSGDGITWRTIDPSNYDAAEGIDIPWSEIKGGAFTEGEGDDAKRKARVLIAMHHRDVAAVRAASTAAGLAPIAFAPEDVRAGIFQKEVEVKRGYEVKVRSDRLRLQSNEAGYNNLEYNLVDSIKNSGKSGYIGGDLTFRTPDGLDEDAQKKYKADLEDGIVTVLNESKPFARIQMDTATGTPKVVEWLNKEAGNKYVLDPDIAATPTAFKGQVIFREKREDE